MKVSELFRISWDLYTGVNLITDLGIWLEHRANKILLAWILIYDAS